MATLFRLIASQQSAVASADGFKFLHYKRRSRPIRRLGTTARWPRASGHIATADTSRHLQVWSSEHCRCRRCRRAGSATAGLAPSIRRPTNRIARWPRRRRANRSADDGSCIRQEERACADRARSKRAQRGEVNQWLCWNNPHNAVTMNVSCAHGAILIRVCPVPVQGTRALPVIVPQFDKYQLIASRCSKAPLDDSVRHVYAL